MSNKSAEDLALQDALFLAAPYNGLKRCHLFCTVFGFRPKAPRPRVILTGATDLALSYTSVGMLFNAPSSNE